ncbi:MAG: hypothetical protein ABI746_08500 [Dermatophilaceae bacterium]
MNPTPTMPQPDQPASDALSPTSDRPPEPSGPITTWATMSVPEHEPPSTPSARSDDVAASEPHATASVQGVQGVQGVQENQGAVRGPNWAAIVVGLACVVLGGTAIWQTMTGQLVDWERYGPFVLGGVGVLMVLAGTVGIIRRAR